MSLKAYSWLIGIIVVVGAFLALGINNRFLKAENLRLESEKKQLLELNKGNASFINNLEKKHKEALRLLRIAQKKKIKQELISSELKLKIKDFKEPLSSEEKEFIKMLYPKAEQ